MELSRQHLFEMEEQRFIEEGFLVTALAWAFVIDTHLEPLVRVQVMRQIHSHNLFLFFKYLFGCVGS